MRKGGQGRLRGGQECKGVHRQHACVCKPEELLWVYATMPVAVETHIHVLAQLCQA